jgi:hypothetical protein
MNSKVRRPPTKFHPKLKGPMMVISNIGAQYKLLNLLSNKHEEHHVSKLREFFYDSDFVDPTEIAKQLKDVAEGDIIEYQVEAIRRHDGDWNKKSEMSFFVKWYGFSEERNTWVGWNELRYNETLHAYIRDIIPAKAASIIPKNLEQQRNRL